MIALLLAVAMAGDPGAPIGAMRIDQMIDSLPACEKVETRVEPTLDLQRGCVLGACTRMTRTELDAALGSSSCGTRQCTWRDGQISALIDDDDKPITSLFIKGSDFRTADGIGVGSSASCLLAGKADQVRQVDVEVREGWLHLRLVWLTSPRLSVRITGDGTIEQLQLTARERDRAAAP